MQAVMNTVGVSAWDDAEILDAIIEGKYIRPVYQPIVSLADGQIFGYEALSRISEDSLKMDIGQMFRTADRANRAWELETLCRKKALKGAADMEADKKLFLNVSPNILHDAEFKEGFTRKRSEKYGVDFHNVIFEITERVAVTNHHEFLDSIQHYRNQNYEIAIDDVGSGYSGLNLVTSVRPNFIKLDLNLVRNIDKDEIKQLLCKAMVDFGRNADIKLIAEGIETQEELETLIKLDVDFGQGYFLGIPRGSFAGIAPEKIKFIQDQQSKRYVEGVRSSVYPTIGGLSKTGYVFSPNEKVEKIYETMRLNPTITEFTVVENNVAVGFMTKAALVEIFGGQYGFSLNHKKNIQQIIKTDFLRVSCNMSVDQVSRLAMQRPFERLYNPIVVEKEGEYSGIVTIKDLLDTCTKIELDTAMHSNPLTGLPGNLLIEKEISRRIFGQAPYCITYYDIDNFKAYNDAYGFQNGDLMIALVADVLKMCAVKNEFIGHIGGDDFIVICDYHQGETYCQSVLDSFTAQLDSLYREEDIQNGYIVSKNRNGVTENFPIASLSVSGISNQTHSYQTLDDFSNDIAKIKKTCKQHPGNYYEIH